MVLLLAVVLIMAKFATIAPRLPMWSPEPKFIEPRSHSLPENVRVCQGHIGLIRDKSRLLRGQVSLAWY